MHNFYSDTKGLWQASQSQHVWHQVLQDNASGNLIIKRMKVATYILCGWFKGFCHVHVDSMSFYL